MKEETESSTVMVSGGFDPVHVGHIRMITAAAKFGDVIIVANSDNWLFREKGEFGITSVIAERFGSREWETHDGDFLGEDQWAWLDRTLAASTARINVIVSGVQVLPDLANIAGVLLLLSATTRKSVMPLLA